jgi:putative heme-binding domain-containing protein
MVQGLPRLTNRWNCVVFLLCVAALVRGAGMEDPHAKKEEGVATPPSPEAIEAGAKLFATACAGCHGQHGEGGRGPKLNDGELVRGATDERLFSSITHGVKGTSMPPFSFTEVEVRRLIAFIRSLSAPASESFIHGDAGNGGSIYYGKGQCATCHSIRGKGGLRGPDLSDIGAVRSVAQLRTALIAPVFQPDGDYRAAKVDLRSGEKLEGVLRGATNYSFELQTDQGDLRLLDAAEIREIRLGKVPLMPSYQGQLTNSELDNILAFLAGQTLRPHGEVSTGSPGH